MRWPKACWRLFGRGLRPTVAVLCCCTGLLAAIGRCNTCTATLRFALEQARREELISRNVAKLVQASVQDAGQHKPYSVEESKRLLAQAQRHRLHALWVMLGVRRGEALALRWADVDLDGGTVAVLGSLQRVGPQLQRVPTKTRGSLRTIPLPAPCVETLRAHRARQNVDRLAAGARWVATELVFTTRHGTPIEPRTVNRMFRH
jgi:integrase